MIHSTVILWAVLAVAFLVAEVCTVAMVSLWFAAGSLAALGAALLGAPWWAQCVVFLVVSGALLALLWKRLRRKPDGAKTNLDSVLGARGYVVEPIDNVAYTGRVKLGGITWAARSSSGEPIPEGTLVQVNRIEGVKVFVSSVEKSVFQENGGKNQ